MVFYGGIYIYLLKMALSHSDKRSFKIFLDPDSDLGSLSKSNYLFLVSLSTFPEGFPKSVHKCLSYLSKLIDRQTSSAKKHSIVGRGKYGLIKTLYVYIMTPQT